MRLELIHVDLLEVPKTNISILLNQFKRRKTLNSNWFKLSLKSYLVSHLACVEELGKFIYLLIYRAPRLSVIMSSNPV